MSKYCHSCMHLFGGIKEGYSAITKMALRQILEEDYDNLRRYESIG
ncbi:hypothetical protein SAMN06295926_112102 [Lysinibacillus sp. AC-3]|nr:hypothetical protein SAMN06295926_112102 [Lysinibacillus sp. AC-3]